MPPQTPHILITAGPTREKIDKVRDWGNIFTGKTGLDLALAFLDLGAVTLLTSNHSHAADYDGYSERPACWALKPSPPMPNSINSSKNA